MAPLVVVELLKPMQFVLQVAGSPKGHEVEIVAPDCAGNSGYIADTFQYLQISIGGTKLS